MDLMLAAVGEGRQRTWEATPTEWMEAQRTIGGYSPQLSKAVETQVSPARPACRACHGPQKLSHNGQS